MEGQRTWDSYTLWQFPRKEILVKLAPEDLKPLSISQRKAEYIIGFAQLLIEGKMSKEMLQGFPGAKEATKELTKIRGIGKWSSNYILLRCLRYKDAYPLGDAALYNSIKNLLGMERKPTDDELLELAIPWEGWQAYATYYLWYGR